MCITMKKLALLVLASLLLAACGQSGPLHLPNGSEPTQSNRTDNDAIDHVGDNAIDHVSDNVIDHVSDAINVIDHVIGTIPTAPTIP